MSRKYTPSILCTTMSGADTAFDNTRHFSQWTAPNPLLQSFSQYHSRYTNDHFLQSALFSLILGIACCGISDTSTRSLALFTFARLLTGVIAAATIFLPRLCSIQTLLTLLISARGLDKLDGHDSYATASIWSAQVGAITPSIVVFSLLAFQILRHRLTAPPRSVVIAVLAFLMIPATTAFVFGGYSDAAAVYYLKTDLRLSALLCSALYLTHLVVEQQPHAHPALVGTIIGAVASRHLLDFFGSFALEGISFGHGNIVSLCPAKTLVAVPLLFALLLVVHKRYTVMSTITIALAIYLTAAYSSRGLYLTTFLSVGYLLVLLPGIRKLKVLVLFAGMAVAGVGALVYFRPDTAFGAYCRVTTLLSGASPAQGNLSPYNGFEAVDPVRYAEFVNILCQASQHWSWILGEGFGASYTDGFARISIDSLSAFPPDQMLIGRFFYAHDLPSHLILKYGVFGLACYITLWLSALPDSQRLRPLLICRRSRVVDLYTCGILSLVAFTPTAIHSLWWTGKGILLTGVLISLLSSFRARLLMSRV